MANVEILLKAVVDKAIADLKKAGGAVDDIDKSASKSAGGVGDFSSAMIGLNQALEVGNKILQAAKMVHDETVGAFIDYAMQVRDMARATGESAEESSRMIQMADDVGVSYEKLKVSLQMAARQGIDISTESLKRMSEEYLTLEPGTQRMQFLLENFGRSGAEMGRLLEMGAAGIDKLNKGVESGLVLSDAILEQARRQEILTDAYQDLIQYKKIAVGANMSEAESWFMLQGMITSQVRVMAEEEQAMRDTKMTGIELQAWMREHRDEAELLVNAMINEKMAADENAGALKELAAAEEEASSALAEVTAEQHKLEAAQQGWLASTANEVVSALGGLGVEGQKYKDALAAIDDVMGTQELAEQQHKDQIKAITDEYARTGDIDAFKNALIGMKDEGLADTTKKLIDTRTEVKRLNDELKVLKDTKEINLKVNYKVNVSGDPVPGNP